MANPSEMTRVLFSVWPRNVSSTVPFASVLGEWLASQPPPGWLAGSEALDIVSQPPPVVAGCGGLQLGGLLVVASIRL